jgi:hypothetical protein
MAWIIDYDVHGDRSYPAPCNANANGMMGPSDYDGDGSELIHQFRMSCLEDVCVACDVPNQDVVYYGRCSSCDDNDAFGPLDDFGEGNYGCNTIEYFNPKTNQWEVL